MLIYYTQRPVGTTFFFYRFNESIWRHIFCSQCLRVRTFTQQVHVTTVMNVISSWSTIPAVLSFERREHKHHNRIVRLKILQLGMLNEKLCWYSVDVLKGRGVDVLWFGLGIEGWSSWLDDRLWTNLNSFLVCLLHSAAIFGALLLSSYLLLFITFYRQAYKKPTKPAKPHATEFINSTLSNGTNIQGNTHLKSQWLLPQKPFSWIRLMYTLTQIYY